MTVIHPSTRPRRTRLMYWRFKRRCGIQLTFMQATWLLDPLVVYSLGDHNTQEGSMTDKRPAITDGDLRHLKPRITYHIGGSYRDGKWKIYTTRISSTGFRAWIRRKLNPRRMGL